MQAPPVIALLYENGTGRHRQNQADTDMLENVCNENNRSRLVGVERAGVSIDAAVLSRYEGQYAFSNGSRTVAGFMGMNHKVTFESSGATVEFFLDATGAVTRLVLGQTEGEAVYRPVSTPATNRRNIGK